MAFARSVNTMGLSLVMSFLGVYVVETRGYPAWSYGLIALVANLTQSMSNAWAGNLSDRIGRRPLITGSLLIRSVFIALLGTQVALDAPLWSLALNMVVSSMLRGCFEPVAYALVADVATDAQRIDAFGLQRMGTNLGWAIGPTLGGVLTHFLPYGHVFYLAAGAMVIAAIVTTRVADPVSRRAAKPDDNIKIADALRDGLAHPLMRLILLGTFLCALLETQMFSTLAIYLTDDLGWHKADVGQLYAINGLGVLLLQLPALRIIRRIGIGVALPWSSLVDAIGFGMIGFATGGVGAALAMVTLTCAEVIFDPSHQTAIAEVADPKHRGRAYGVVGFTQTVGIALAPLTGGILLDTLGPHHVAIWLVIAMFGVGQTVCFWLFVKRRLGQAAPTSIPAAQQEANV
jgi:MFS family permease